MVNTFPPYNFSFKLFDLITIAIPPILPVALTFGKLVITINLNMRNILCQKSFYMLNLKFFWIENPQRSRTEFK